MTSTILSHQEIEFKIKRIAYQIYEANVEENEIIIAGITGGGLNFASKIADVLEVITKAKIVLGEITINKNNPLESNISTNLDSKTYRNKSVVLVDDVLNSGTTLIYGVQFFLQTPLKQLKTAVLVNRNHKKFPVKADYKGISLSTSINEHVVVDLTNNAYTVYLN